MKLSSLVKLAVLPVLFTLSAHAATHQRSDSDEVISRYRDDIDMMDRATPEELARILQLSPDAGEALTDERPSGFWDLFGYGRGGWGYGGGWGGYGGGYGYGRGGGVFIRVDISSQTLSVSSPEGGTSMPVSTARAGYHTARGCFRGPHLEVMHYSRKWDWSPMPHSIFYHGGFAIHGTYAEGLLGRPASHGCIRVSRAGAAYLFRLVQTYGRSRTRICVY